MVNTVSLVWLRSCVIYFVACYWYLVTYGSQRLGNEGWVYMGAVLNNAFGTREKDHVSTKERREVFNPPSVTYHTFSYSLKNPSKENHSMTSRAKICLAINGKWAPP